MLTPYLPYPLVSGGQIRTYNLLKNLATKHKITLASFVRDPAEEKYLKNLEPFCEKVITFKRRKAWSPLNIILSGITPFPFLVSIYFDIGVRRKIREELEREKYDLIHAETFYVMPNIPETKVPIFLVEQVIEYLVYQRFIESLPKLALLIKPLLQLDVLKIKWWEKYYWRKSKRLAAMSNEDKRFIEKSDPNLKVDVIANGVDIEFFEKTRKLTQKNPIILFVGNFKWLPNRDATKFLIEEIWPNIKKSIKNARLWIVGRNPPEDILKFESEDINIDSQVEDIREAYGKSSVLVAPIRNGRGTKYKILEAMATKTPIVGTRLAIEGLNIINGKEALIGSSSDDLAKQTIRILKDKKLESGLAENAYELVKNRYDWKKISKELDRVYQEVGAI